MNIEYRNIDKLNAAELRFVAEQDSKVPLLYDPDYTWTEKSIDERLGYYERIKPEDFFEVAVSDRKVIGFHVIHKISYPPDLKVGMIATLWVDPDFRGKRIAAELKSRGEQWARQEKLAFLQTGVHPNNARMMEMNKKSGFEVVQYSLRKRLT